jgi:NAD(P)-dependent dehydrogenase (short-subunit alcohol dehydrogenase family)
MPHAKWNFVGERILVSGGGGGIGLAIGEAFVRSGARVVLLGRDAANLTRAVEAAGCAGEGEVSSMVCDLQKPTDIARAAGEVTDLLGGIDILVNNAGVSMHVPLVECADEVIELTLDVNLRAVMLLTREFLPGMLERGRGNVISVSSQAAKRGWPENIHYSASKAGVLGFTLALAAEVAPAVPVARCRCCTLRETVRRRYLEAVTTLARITIDNKPEQALDLLETARNLEPLNEAIYRDIIRIQQRLGRPDAAAATFQLLHAQLADIDATPSPATVALARKIEELASTE